MHRAFDCLKRLEKSFERLDKKTLHGDCRQKEERVDRLEQLPV